MPIDGQQTRSANQLQHIAARALTSNKNKNNSRKKDGSGVVRNAVDSVSFIFLYANR